MSELIQKNDNRATIRWKLLTSASALALTAYVASASMAEAGDHDTVWIEMGGAFDSMTAGDTRWLPPNLTPPQSKPTGPFGGLPTVGYDSDLKISFQPENSGWIFSAGIRYGRALSAPKRSHDQTYKSFALTSSGVPYSYHLTNEDFTNTMRRSKSAHMMLDFQASKDVGLGLFGGESLLGLGVRVAKLNESANGHMTAFSNAYFKYNPNAIVHKADFLAKHSFSGLGPQVTWDAATPFAGNLSEGFSLDWGANAALLFGRQKANVSLRTKDERYNYNVRCGYYDTQFGQAKFCTGVPSVLSHSTQTPRRSKSVMVPNLGGFAALSWHLPDAKLSIGYRADFFFNAMDGGVAARKSETRGFFGPYASISIGLGD